MREVPLSIVDILMLSCCCRAAAQAKHNLLAGKSLTCATLHWQAAKTLSFACSAPSLPGSTQILRLTSTSPCPRLELS